MKQREPDVLVLQCHADSALETEPFPFPVPGPYFTYISDMQLTHGVEKNEYESLLYISAEQINHGITVFYQNR